MKKRSKIKKLNIKTKTNQKKITGHIAIDMEN